MSYYDQITSAEKDQLNTQKAEETFQRLVMLYPDSKYTKDVLQKINLAEDYKAAQEMIIGRYYLSNKNYLSALNRFNVVLEQYQKTVQIEEALYREVEIYAILGMNKYAKGYYKILNMNYPSGKWTAKAAKIMERIGENKKKVTAEKDAVDEPWYKFGWPWFENKTAEIEEKPALKEKIVVSELPETEEEIEVAKKPWYKFGWPWFENKAAEVKEEQKVSVDSGKPWYKFGWPWFKSDEKNKEGSF